MLNTCWITVSKSKITKKWKPITTILMLFCFRLLLFQRAKLQKNESQSQLHASLFCVILYCFKEQNYKKMKANHNQLNNLTILVVTVSKSKITKKWKPITTFAVFNNHRLTLFQRAKLQKNESQSQHKLKYFFKNLHCFKEQNYKKMKANHNLIMVFVFL